MTELENCTNFWNNNKKAGIRAKPWIFDQQCKLYGVVYALKKDEIFKKHYEAKLCFLWIVRGFRNKDSLFKFTLFFHFLRLFHQKFNLFTDWLVSEFQIPKHLTLCASLVQSFVSSWKASNILSQLNWKQYRSGVKSTKYLASIAQNAKNARYFSLKLFIIKIFSNVKKLVKNQNLETNTLSPSAKYVT